ncbi:MAG: hypothetical protein IJI38_03875, partial [Clostridia bacterium]|nr:hypothetical protein [Clostridia bacterium]
TLNTSKTIKDEKGNTVTDANLAEELLDVLPFVFSRQTGCRNGSRESDISSVAQPASGSIQTIYAKGRQSVWWCHVFQSVPELSCDQFPDQLRMRQGRMVSVLLMKRCRGGRNGRKCKAVECGANAPHDGV